MELKQFIMEVVMRWRKTDALPNGWVLEIYCPGYVPGKHVFLYRVYDWKPLVVAWRELSELHGVWRVKPADSMTSSIRYNTFIEAKEAAEKMIRAEKVSK